MKAGILFSNNNVKYVDMDMPEITDDSVRIKVEAVGICGSDLPRVFKHGARTYPMVLGHEFSGVIEGIGKNVESLHVGDHVVGIPLIPCFNCDDCIRGNYSLCKHYSFIGSRQQGAMAEYVVVPKTNVIKIDKSIPFDTAAMFEPSTVALHGIFLNKFLPDKTAVILGGGTIGLFVLQWLKILNAKKIVIVGRNKSRLTLSEKFGADQVISILDENYYDSFDIEGYDYVFETAGSTDTMQLAFRLAANKANICFIGTPTKELVFSPEIWEQMNRKEFNLTGSWMSYSTPFPGKEWEMTAEHFKLGDLKIDEKMFHAKYPLKNIDKAFDEFSKPNNDVIGKIIIYNE